MKHMARFVGWTAFFVSALALALAGCASPEDPTVAGTDGSSTSSTSMGTGTMSDGMTGMAMGMTHVSVLDGRFEPKTINATREGGVHFTNDGQHRHTVSIVDDSGAIVVDQELESGEAFHFAPEHAGSYYVFCRLRSDMSANIRVV
jgi:plastocyanin